MNETRNNESQISTKGLDSEMEKKMKNLCNMCEENTGRVLGYVQSVDSSNTIVKNKKFLCDFCYTEFAIKEGEWN